MSDDVKTSPARKTTARRRKASIAPELYLYRLVSRAELGRTAVVSVETPVGRLAVGVAKGRPFAVSGTCRHLFAALGEGRVTREGCLQCPWHRSRYDVTTGHMVRGPQGLLFLSVRELVHAYTNLLFPLQVFPVVERDSVLYLDTTGIAG
ncbi:MAG: Rieske (2Fe-2S) protein [Candidatus Dormibacteraeota bacterium]|nr:Rieske (2Fe-2S) protein [Candidatus Dormibacteraeota bacterium]